MREALAVIVLLLVLSGCAEAGKQLGSADEEQQAAPTTERATPNTPTNPAPVTTARLPTTASTLDPNVEYWSMNATAPRDVTAEVLASNQFNEPPPEGFVYAGFDVTFTLDSVGPDGYGVPLGWQLKLEGSDRFYDQFTATGDGCGPLDGEVDMFVELKEGASVSGLYCIPLPADELATAKVYADNGAGERQQISP